MTAPQPIWKSPRPLSAEQLAHLIQHLRARKRGEQDGRLYYEAGMTYVVVDPPDAEGAMRVRQYRGACPC